MIKNIILTGATGFLGKEVSRILSKKNYSYKAICSDSNLEANHISCDLSNTLELINLLSKEKPSIVINLAAKVSFTASISELYSLNILCPAIIADFCLKNDSFLVQASSIAVNGKNQTLYSVNTPLQPNTNYGRSKLLAENVILGSGCDSSVLRFGGIFGANGPDHLGINKAINNAQKGKRPILYGVGDIKRNYIYVKDAAEAIVKCAEEKLTGVHCLGGEEKTIRDMLSDICEVLIPGQLPEHIKGEKTTDQIVENSPYFETTSFRTAIEEIV